jgi:hypothetical protein
VHFEIIFSQMFHVVQSIVTHMLDSLWNSSFLLLYNKPSITQRNTFIFGPRAAKYGLLKPPSCRKVRSSNRPRGREKALCLTQYFLTPKIAIVPFQIIKGPAIEELHFGLW